MGKADQRGSTSRLQIVYKVVGTVDCATQSRVFGKYSSARVLPTYSDCQCLCYEINKQTKAPSKDAPIYVFSSLWDAWIFQITYFEKILKCVGKMSKIIPERMDGEEHVEGTVFCDWVFPLEEV